MTGTERNAAERAAVEELRARGWPNARPSESLEASDGYLVRVRTESTAADSRTAEVVVGLDLKVKAWKFIKGEGP